MPPNPMPTKWWHTVGGGERIVCDLCPRHCQLKPGDRGFCFVRENVDGQMILSTYGRSTGFCIDPVEKKPLNHFYPGTPVLSFGTAGCNLGCKFCQNWDISKSREVSKLSEFATPEKIADAALQLGCTSVAFTYNDPVIWAEYAIDTAEACRERGIKTIAVTAGYISPAARSEFFNAFDAANIDLKAFTEDFYYHVTLSHLQPVLETLQFLRDETNVWFELTNLIIPGANDSDDEVRKMCDWIVQHLGSSVPIHFSAFHPDFRMQETPATPPETLHRAYKIACQAGIKYPYVGNIHDPKRQNTYCPSCKSLLIQRDWYAIGQYALKDHHCSFCGAEIAGKFSNHPGKWGRKRLPVQLNNLHPTRLPVVPHSSTKPPTPSTARTLQCDTEGLPGLQPSHQTTILNCACHLVTNTVVGNASGPATAPRLNLPPEIAELQVFGVFVTLKRDGHLRGCCGMVGQTFRFAEALALAAKRTAMHDHRFNPIQADELDSLTISVSILGPLSRLAGTPREIASQLRLGHHGLKIQHGSATGLLLPQVAIEQQWSATEFLAGVSRKAGLEEDHWQSPEAILEIFPGIVFEAPFAQQALPSTAEIIFAEHPFPLQGLQQLLQHAGQNIDALLRGATPMVYSPDLPDRDVCGLILTAESETTPHQWHWSQIALTPNIPLQSTLFTLCQAVTTAIHRGALAAGNSDASRNFRLGLSILTEGVECGSLAEPRLMPFDSRRHGFLLLHGDQWSFCFLRAADAATILHTAKSSIGLLDSHAALLRFHCDSTLPHISVFRKPDPPTLQTQPTSTDTPLTTRPPAFAGLFYPALQSERKELVQTLIATQQPAPSQTHENTPPLQCTAILTPHAALKYSGRVAASVWSRVRLPSRVLIITPKHTPAGAPWAVAPHPYWSLSPETVLRGDEELAQLIASQVDGMRLDVEAHRREHGIEVQLPFLAHLAPETKITAIAMHGGSWDQIAAAAEQLSTTLLELPELPLVVISSDMNHFANEIETRRRDALAWQAFSSRDGSLLLETCRMHEISMCGVIPAALTLQLLKYIDPDYQVTQVAYGTSAETSGNTQRVVGYASAVLR